MGGHHRLSKAKLSECSNSPGAWASISGPSPQPPQTPFYEEVSSYSISICLNQGILPSRFATFPGSLPPCPVGVPSQPYSCILSPCAMVVDGWDCVGERPVWQGPLGATGIWTIGRPLEASAVDNPGPFLGMLHVCMPVHLCVCVGGVFVLLPLLPLTLVLLRRATCPPQAYELHTF